MSRRVKRTIPTRKTNPIERRLFNQPEQVEDLRNPEYRDILRQNMMVDDASYMLNSMPKAVADNQAVQGAVDALVTAKYLPSDGRAQIPHKRGRLAGQVFRLRGIVLGYAPRDLLAVADELHKTSTRSAVWVAWVSIPCEARNNVSAAKIVGTENMLEALAADELKQMRAQTKWRWPVELEGLSDVQSD